MRHASLDRMVLLALALQAACGSGGNGGTEPGPTPAIAISLSSSGASVAQGGSTQVTATLTRSGGFTGAVDIAVNGAPTGVTGSAGNAQTSGGVTTATVTITVAAATATGVYNLTVVGTGSGVSSATANFALTVTGAAAGSYNLTMAAGVLTLTQGTNGSTTININRSTGYTGSVTLTVTGAPTGVTPGISPASTTGSAATLTVTVAAATAVGQYVLTIHGNATGLAEQLTVVTLNVSAASTGSNYTVNFGSCLAAVWAAYQDGAGPWTVATISNGSAIVSWGASKVGLAYAASVGGRTMVFVTYMARSEISGNTVSLCPAQPTSGPNVMNGTAAGLASNDVGLMSIGGNVGSALSVQLAFQVTNVLGGTQDFFGFRHSSSGTPNPDRLVVRRDIAVSNGGSVGAVVDFNGAEAMNPATGTITLQNTVAGGPINQTMGYQSGANCAYANFYTATVAGTSFTASGVPDAVRRASDIHQLLVTTHAAGDNNNNMNVTDYFHSLTPHTITFGGLLPAPTMTVLAGPYKRLQAVVTAPNAYTLSTGLTYADAGVVHQVAVNATVAYQGGFDANLVMPDFSGLAGWNNAWAPASGATVNWGVTSNGGTTDLVNVCAGGDAVFRAATRTGSI